jgi:hypothetical protein
MNKMWYCASVIPVTREAEVGGSQSKASLGKVSQRPYLKNTKGKRSGGVAQVIRALELEALHLITNITHQKKKKRYV